MSAPIVSNIKLRRGEGIIRFDYEPPVCAHAWEFHVWEAGAAYCPKCGSLATAENDPRLAAGADQ